MLYSDKKNISIVFFNGELREVNSAIKTGKMSDITEVDITKGTTPTTIGFEILDKPTEENIKFFKIENINTEFAEHKNFISLECNEKLKRSQLEIDDILFSIAGTIGRTYKVKPSDIPGNTNQAIAIIRIKNKNNVDFYKYYIDHIVDTLNKNTQGGVISNFNLSNLKNVDILLFDDQEILKITKILNMQKTLIDSYKEKLKILKKQEQYYQDEILSGRYRIVLTKDSILYATKKGWYLNDNLIKEKEQDFYEWMKIDFHSKVFFQKENELIDFKQNSFKNKISSHFELYKIGEIGVVKTGNTPSKKEENNYGGDFNWYTTPDFNNGTVFDSKLKLSKKGWDLARVADINDILITCIGELGQIALVKKEGGFNQQINSLKVNDNYYYYYIFMLLKNHKVYIQSFSKKNVVDIINKNDFSNIPIYVTPYITEQISIVIFLKMFEEQKNNINEKINLEQKKFDFLMDGLLSGIIRVN